MKLLSGLKKYITKCTVTAPVLLLLGLKGVGKTHLGASIIREAGGTFISIELGREAERQLKREREWER